MSRRVALHYRGRTIEAVLTTHGPRTRVESEGLVFEARVKRDGPIVTMERRDRGARVAVAMGAHGLWAAYEGRTFRFELPGGESSAGPAEIEENEVHAPMTARVVAVAVESGAVVAEGALLATLEAMKMEFRLTAPFAGAVAEVLCRAGDRVEVGQLLLRLSPRAAPDGGEAGS